MRRRAPPRASLLTPLHGSGLRRGGSTSTRGGTSAPAVSAPRTDYGGEPVPHGVTLARAYPASVSGALPSLPLS